MSTVCKCTACRDSNFCHQSEHEAKAQPIARELKEFQAKLAQAQISHLYELREAKTYIKQTKSTKPAPIEILWS